MFEIFDGVQWSYPAYVTVAVVADNDNAPVVDLSPLGQVGLTDSPSGCKGSVCGWGEYMEFTLNRCTCAFI